MARFSLSSEWVVNAFILIIAYYPPIGILNYVNPIILLYCIWQYAKVVRLGWAEWGVLTTIVCSFCINLTLAPQDVNMQSVSRAIMICLMIVFFPFVNGFRIYNTTIYIGIFYLFFSQIMYFIHFEPLVRFFNTYYPYDGDINIYTSDYLSQQSQILSSNSRLGGLFHNPNNCARIFNFFLAVYLIENPISNKIKLTVEIFLIWCILLTGSRTGLFVGLILCLLDYGMRVGRRNRYRMIGAGTLLLVLFMLYNNADTEAYRALRLSEGTGDSFKGKVEIFKEYISQEHSFLHLLFGHFDQHSITNYLKEASTMDSEWGYSIFNYGIIYTFFIVFFYIKRIRMLRERSILIVVPMLWMISASILFAFRESLLYFILFSIYSLRILGTNHYATRQIKYS